MLTAKTLGEQLGRLGIRFYSGVPCSLLKPLINYAMTEVNYLPAVNEGDAVAHCAGAWMGGQKAAVLLQNSGLGNAVSPLTSLNHPFKIPLLGFVSLRGDPDHADEPQHELLGTITAELLDAMKIQWAVLSDDESTALAQLEQANHCLERKQSFFFIVKKATFHPYPTPPALPCRPRAKGDIVRHSGLPTLPKREALLSALKDYARSQDSLVLLATTGLTGRELYELGHSDRQFYMVGSMGCISAIGMGLALTRKDLKVIAIDGDGALLMRMGNMATVGALGPDNFCHLVFDNQAHESTGGQETVAKSVDFPGVAQATGYAHVVSAHSEAQLMTSIDRWLQKPTSTFIHLPIQVHHRKDLGRPQETPEALLEQLTTRLVKREVC